jgi:hypothetical protein
MRNPKLLLYMFRRHRKRVLGIPERPDDQFPRFRKDLEAEYQIRWDAMPADEQLAILREIND